MVTKINFIIKSVKQKIQLTKLKFLQLRLAYKIYLIGGLSFASIVIINNLIKYPPLNNSTIPFVFIISILSVGFIVEAFQTLKRFYQYCKKHKNYKSIKLAIKLISGVMFYFLVQLSYTMAKHNIHSFNHLSPNQFSNSSIWLATLNGISIVMGGVIILLFILYIASFFGMIFSRSPAWLARILGGMWVIMGMGYISDNIIHSAELKRWILAHTDYYAASQCDVDPRFRVAYLKGNKISIAYLKNSQWYFKTSECHKLKTKS